MRAYLCYNTPMASFFRRFGICLSSGIASVVLAPRAAADNVQLLEPINSVNQIDTSNPNFFFVYINALYPWVMGICAGLVIFWGMFGAMMMVQAGGDQAKFSSAKNHVVAALAGLLLILFARAILHTINPTFFF